MGPLSSLFGVQPSVTGSEEKEKEEVEEVEEEGKGEEEKEEGRWKKLATITRLGQGVANFYCQGSESNYSRLGTIYILSELLNSVLVARKQPHNIHK